MNYPKSLLCLLALSMVSCKKDAERYEGDEVFGVPALVASGTTNSTLESVLPPGLQDLDLGMTREEVAKSRAHYFQETGPAVHGLNESTIELHGFENQRSSLPIDRVELSFSDETDCLDQIWARSEWGTSGPEDLSSLVQGLVEIFGEPSKSFKIKDGRDFGMIWRETENGSGIKVLFKNDSAHRPTVDFWIESKEVLGNDSGLNKWIAEARSEEGVTASEFTKAFIAKAFP